ncbi:MAG: hypothetical protein O3A55_03070 [Bacteroidetes bacterium]|nr:hypothetical protein [Bacteroidota bacterium]
MKSKIRRSQTFAQGSTLGILLNFCAKNPPHRQARERCNKNKKRVV